MQMYCYRLILRNKYIFTIIILIFTIHICLNTFKHLNILNKHS